MKNRYPISEAHIRKFSNDNDTWIRKWWYDLHNGLTIITISGHSGSTFDPKIQWKLKPNGDGTFSAYRL